MPSRTQCRLTFARFLSDASNFLSSPISTIRALSTVDKSLTIRSLFIASLALCGITNSAFAQVTAPTFTKAFGGASVILNQDTTVTFTITNNDTVNGLSGISFSDTLPAGLTVDDNLTGDCNGTVPTFTTSTITLTNASLPFSGQCQFALKVKGVTAGTFTNPAITLNATDNSTPPTPVSAMSSPVSIDVVAPPVLGKAFTCSMTDVECSTITSTQTAIATAGGTTTLVYTITNPAGNTEDLTGVTMTDSFPPGLKIPASPAASTTCDGGATLTAIPGTHLVLLQDAVVAIGTSCTVTVPVIGSSTPASPICATETNSATITSSNGGSGASGHAMVTLVCPPAITKGFAPNPIAVNGNSTLTLTVTNPNSDNFATLTQVSFTDLLPASVIGQTGTLTNGCPSATPTHACNVAPTFSSNTISLSNATIAPNQFCCMTLTVQGTVAGAQVNTTGQPTSKEGGTGTSAKATLNVLAAPTGSKSFSPNQVPVNTATSLFFTIQNPNPVTIPVTPPLSVTLTDTFPTGLTGTPGSASPATCGSNNAAITVTATGVSITGASLPAGGSCVFSVTVTPSTSGDKVNNGMVCDPTAGCNSFTDTLHVESPPSIVKSFASPTIPLNGSTTLSFLISNTNGITLHGVAFSDTLPMGLTISSSPNVSNSCNGTVTATGGTTGISLSGGSIAANSSCTVSLSVTGNVAGVYLNTAGPVTSTEGGTGNSSSASLTVVSPPSILKTFLSPSIPEGGSTTLSFKITNTNGLSLTGVAFSDTLPTGLVVSSTPGVVNGCGGTFTANAGTTGISLTGGTVPANNFCTITLSITGNAAGAYMNTAGPVTSTEGGTGNSSTANLTVAAPPSILKTFGASTIPQGGSTTVSFHITNSNGIPLTGVAFSDTLPTGLVVSSSPGVTNTCNGTVTATALTTGISLSGGSIAANNSCTISVNITGNVAGPYTNTAGPVTSTEGGTGNSSSANLTVVAPPIILKTFNPTVIAVGGTTTVSFKITNPNALTLTGVAFSDTLPTGLVVTTPPGTVNGCSGSVIASAGTTGISLSGGTVPANNFCTVTVSVTGNVAGGYTNTAGPVTSSEGGTGNSSSANLTVAAPPILLKTFAVAMIPAGGSTTLTFKITNPNGITLNGLAFSDTLPTGLVVSSTPNANNGCGGTFTAVGGTTAISLAGGSVAANTFCTITVSVTGNVAGVYTNTAGPVTSTEGGQGNSSSANLTVVSPPTILKTFASPTIPVGGSTTLSFKITNTNGIPLTGVAFSDTLPTGLVISTTPGVVNGCGGSVTAVAGTTAISLSGGTVPANNFCTLSLSITGNVAGPYTNTAGPVTSTEGGAGNSSSANLTVASPPVLLKTFAASTIPLNGSTTLTLKITNSNGIPLTGIAVSDTLPTGLVISASPNAVNGCGGSLTAAGGTTGISLTGGTVAANTFCTITLSITGNVAGAYTNTAGPVMSNEGGQGNSSSANLTVVAPPSLLKTFAASTIPVNGSTTLTLKITNPNGIPLTGLAVSDTLPTGLVISTPPNAVNGCGGSLTANAGTTGISLTGGTVAANTFCTITLSVTGNAAGAYTNTAGPVTSTEGAQGNSSSANLTVVSPPTLLKTFGAATIPLNGSTTLTLKITNSNSITLNGIAVSDTLPTGLVISSTPNVNNTCGGSVTAVAGTTSISLTGGSVPANTFCALSLSVTGNAAGLVHNTAGPVTSTEGGTGNSSSANITVVAPPSITKTFGAPTIPLNGSTSLTFKVTNSNGVALTGLAFTDTLPTGLVVSSTPNVNNGCGGTFTANAGTTGISLTGGTVAANTFCTISLNITGNTAGPYTNTTGAVTSTEGGTGNTGTANITVVAPPSITKVFGAPTIPVNGSTSLTFKITNSNALALTGLAFTDTLPTGLVISTPANVNNGCGGTFTANSGTTGISLTGGTVAANTFCTISLNITGNTAGPYTNTTGAVSSTEGGTGNTATANITVVAPPSITKTFGAPTIPLNGSTTLTFKITNSNAIALTGLAFTDTLPTGLVVSSTPNVNNGCGGTVTANGGTTGISLTGGTVAANTFCTISLNVTGNTAGAYTNTTGAVTSTEGGTGNTATANLTVVSPPSITKTFGAPNIPLNGSTTLTFKITNSNAIALTGLAFTDTLPTGLVVSSTPNVNNGCGGSVTALAGTTGISLTGGTVAANTFCTISLNVTGNVAGAYTNTTSAITSTEGGTGNTASANLTVVAPPSITKTFGASSIPLNTSTTLTFKITNSNGIPLNGVAFTDTLPTGLVVSTPPNLNNGCGGTVTANGGTTSISLTGGTVAANTFCTISLNITGTAAGGFTNTTSAITSTEGGTGNTATAQISVVGPPSILKTFSATSIPLNGTATVTFKITNPNTITLNGIGFNDTLPTGLTVATPSNLNNGCGGTASASGGSVSLTGATLGAGANCTITVDVTGTTVGLKSNSVTVTSTNGGTGNTSTATINVAPPPPTISKSFAVPSIPLNGTTALSFTITNPSADPAATLTGVAFSDTLPAGLVVATPNGLTGSCPSGTISAVAGSHSISLSGATLAPSASCTFAVNVKGVVGGTQNNVTGNVTATESGPGNTASASIFVIAPPSIAKSFNPSSIPLNGTSTMTFVLTNPAVNSDPVLGILTGVNFTDNLPPGIVVSTPTSTNNKCGGTLTALQGATSVSLTGVTLQVNSSCTITVAVTGIQIGTWVNTVTANSTNGGPSAPSSATLTVGQAQVQPPTIVKSFQSPTDTVPAGGTVTIIFTISNPNPSAKLTGIGFTDTLPAGFTVSGSPSTNCPSGTVTAPTTSSIKLVGAKLDGGDSCTVTVLVMAPNVPDGTRLCDTTSKVTSVEGGSGLPSSACISIGTLVLPADVFLVNYVSDLDKGDSVVNFTNSGTLNGTDPFGNICVNVYAFSPDEQLVACCTCLVSPNGLHSLSVNGDLTNNTLTPAAPPSSLVIKLLATAPVAGVCDAASPTNQYLVQGTRAWATTLHQLPGSGLAVEDRRFEPGNLSQSELLHITSFCGFIEQDGSGFGICNSCRTGALGGAQHQ